MFPYRNSSGYFLEEQPRSFSACAAMCAKNPCRCPALERSEKIPCYIHAADLSLPEYQLNKSSDKASYNEPGQGSQHTEVVRGLMNLDWLSPLVSERWKNSVDQHGLQNGPASSNQVLFLVWWRDCSILPGGGPLGVFFAA